MKKTLYIIKFKTFIIIGIYLTMNTIDFENIRTYMEIVFIFFFILTGTYLYSFKDFLPWIAPFVVLSYGIIISLFAIYQYYEYLNVLKKRDDNSPNRIPRTIGAGIIWILWLIYGIIFKDVSVMFPTIIGCIQSSIIVLLVLLTYLPEIKEKPIWTNGIFFFVLLLLFIPHSDTISHNMDKFILFIKIFVFYILYGLTETLDILQQEENNKFDISNIEYQNNKWIYKTEIKIIRSCWILLTSKYLILGVIFQIIPLWIELLKYKHKVNVQKLPTTSDFSFINKNNLKKQLKRHRNSSKTIKSKKETKRNISKSTIYKIGNIQQKELDCILDFVDDDNNIKNEKNL